MILQGDTELFSWESLAELMNDDRTSDILWDVGMPIAHRNVKYNCRVHVYNKKILLIRPVSKLAPCY